MKGSRTLDLGGVVHRVVEFVGYSRATHLSARSAKCEASARVNVKTSPLGRDSSGAVAPTEAATRQIESNVVAAILNPITIPQVA